MGRSILSPTTITCHGGVFVFFVHTPVAEVRLLGNRFLDSRDLHVRPGGDLGKNIRHRGITNHWENLPGTAAQEEEAKLQEIIQRK